MTGNFPSTVTSVLLKANICDASGNALDLVRYNGVLFKQDSFLEYVLNVLKTKNQLNMWYEDGQDDGGNTKYTQIGKEYVKLENMGDGKVKVVFTNENETSLYTEDGANSSDQIIAALNENLAAASADAIAYNGGSMYYNIPIEHLNNGDVTNGTIPEAKYGVVRGFLTKTKKSFPAKIRTVTLITLARKSISFPGRLSAKMWNFNFS